jgi:cytochrome c553
MKKLAASTLLIVGFVFGSTAAIAGGDPEAGQQKSQVCQACHGTDGKGNIPTYPVLAGQYADYMEQALKAYRDGDRSNAIMAGIAGPLSDEDIEDLAAYYSAMEGLKDLSIK